MNKSIYSQLKHHGQRGTTLVEVILTMGLLAGFLVILTTIFTESVDTQSQTTSYAAITTDGRYVLARLNYDLRRASAITAPAALGDSGSSLTLTINGDDYTYAISSGRLALTVDGNTDYLTADNDTVSGLSFQKLGNSGGVESVRYSFTISSSSAHNTDSQTFTSTAGLRP